MIYPRWRSYRSWTDKLSKRDLSTPLQIDKDEAIIRKGYLSDNAIKFSLKKKVEVHVMDSMEAEGLNSKDFLAAKSNLTESKNTSKRFLWYYILIPLNILLVFM